MHKALRQLFIFTLILLLVSANTAIATEITPRADTEFNSTAIVLKSTKTVSFRANTYDIKSSIAVTACWLQYQKDDGTWTTLHTLPVPTEVGYNTFSFSTYRDYSSYIGTGTYRIRATFTADGHMLTRFSNERTF